MSLSTFRTFYTLIRSRIVDRMRASSNDSLETKVERLERLVLSH